MNTRPVQVLFAHGPTKRSERGLGPRNPRCWGEGSEGGVASLRRKYGAKTPKAGGAA